MGDAMFKQISLLIVCFLVVSFWWVSKDPAAAVTEKLLAKKDISSYTGSDMVLTVRELEFPPAFNGTKHRHPGPVVVCVLEGSLEIALEGQPPQTYNRGQCFSEEPHQLHIYTRNASKAQPARIISYILSRNGEPLSQPEE
jgi:quercetin dioxygenase-like cupin family protein